MEAHFVTFFSPGTFVAEQTTRPIDSWDVSKAIEMSAKIVERYEARPYAFRFSTRGRTDAELDSKTVKESGMYYLGGKVETLAEIKARNNPEEKVLIANMEGNGWARVVTTESPWRWTQPLEDDDQVLWIDPLVKACNESGPSVDG